MRLLIGLVKIQILVIGFVRPFVRSLTRSFSNQNIMLFNDC